MGADGVDESIEPGYPQTGHPGLRRGPWHPRRSTPETAPASARRTTSIDVARPDGLLGRCEIDVRGRDVAVGAGGDLRVVDEVAVAVDVDPAGRVRDLTGGPDAAGVAPLVGAGLRSGYGRRLAEALGGELERRTLLATLFEDLAAAYLVSGYAPLEAGLFPPDPATAGERAGHMADICAGWATGGPLHRVLAEEGRSAVPVGPAAPALEGDDPSGWHGLPDLAVGTVRRRRSLDVVPRAAGGDVELRAHFRDSHGGVDGETVMHEYAVVAFVDGDGDGTGAGGRITGVEVEPRVLPWEACPEAVGSADRLVGVALADLPRHVRADLVGPSTCTHLSSTLRTLADARSLTLRDPRSREAGR